VKTYRILSIDGGGIKGVFPASLLAAVEKALAGPVGSYFDLIAGTSTGGIIALGLGLGFRAAELLEFYETLGPQVFGGNRAKLWLRHWGLSKYDSAPLRRALEGKFGTRRIGDSLTRLVIPSMNVETGKVYIYKTAHHPHLETDYRVPAVEAAMATASAPTYFPTHLSSSGVPLIDGGVWANNPVGMAVVEAVGVLGWPRDQLRVLSVGCTVTPFSVGARRKAALGKIPWAAKVADVFMAGQSSASLGTAYVLAGHENVMRINPTVPAGRFELDTHGEIRGLRGLGESEAREALPKLKATFFQQPAEAFAPCYS
jgi:predicted acylesterase/phospholipase RssA